MLTRACLASRSHAELHRFFETRVYGRFPDALCCLDVYVDRGDRVWLLDFHTFGGATDSLLFSWAELRAAAAAAMEPGESARMVCCV
jgi:D123